MLVILDPCIVKDIAIKHISERIMAWKIELDGNIELDGWLALSWQISYTLFPLEEAECSVITTPRCR